MFHEDTENDFEDEENGPKLHFAFEMEDYEEKDE